MIKRLLGWLFTAQYIGHGYCCRYRIWEREDGRSLYLNHYIGSDSNRFPHDHPKRFWSLGLWGRYIEETPGHSFEVFTAPWFRSFTAEHTHLLSMLPDETCWTLVYTSTNEREWGFWDGDLFMPQTKPGARSKIRKQFLEAYRDKRDPEGFLMHFFQESDNDGSSD